MIINRVCKLFKDNKILYAIVGGYAVALHGAPRHTHDLDIVIRWTKKNLTKAVDCLEACGLVSRLPIKAEEVFNFRDEYIEKRNLIAWNFYNPKAMNEQVDLLINYDLAGKRTKKIQTPFTELKILNLKDLIDMKRAAGRKIDFFDIERLEELHK